MTFQPRRTPAIDSKVSVMSDVPLPLLTPPWIDYVIQQYEGKPYFADFELYGSVSDAMKKHADAEPREQKAANAERSAFGFHPHEPGANCPWGTYFGPAVVIGEHCGPDIKWVDAEVIAYWQSRTTAARHPLMRARYADLVWDLWKAVGGQRPHVEVARTAIDGYISASQLAETEHFMEVSKQLARALQLALAIGDKKRVEAARDAMFAFFGRVDGPYGWMILWNTLDRFSKLVPTPVQWECLTAGLERQIQHVDSLPEGVQPAGTTEMAGRLAQYYRKNNRENDARRVILAAGRAVERQAAGVNAMLAHAWLDHVYVLYTTYGLREDAQRVLLTSREKATEAQANMPTMSIAFTIDKEEFEKYLDDATAGNLDETLARIAAHHLPDLAQVRARVEEQKRAHPLISMVSTTKLSEGQAVARTGPAGSDPEGALVAALAQDIVVISPFLTGAFDRTREKHGLTSEMLVSFLHRSPIFQSEFRDLMSQGVDAYMAGDHVKAISVLVPQIENALRRYLQLLGQPPNKDWRGDATTKLEKNLNDILEREQVIKDALGEGVHLYLLTFLADPRGHNLRNRLGHGLMTAADFRREISDRVLHILLVLALGTPLETGETPNVQSQTPALPFPPETAEE